MTRGKTRSVHLLLPLLLMAILDGCSINQSTVEPSADSMMVCTPADAEMVKAMSSLVPPSELGTGDSGVLNPTVVIATPKWQVVTFGYGFGSSATYVAKVGSIQASTWVEIDGIGADPAFSDSEVNRIDDAAELALLCMRGG